jgi:hypothetical protein
MDGEDTVKILDYQGVKPLTVFVDLSGTRRLGQVIRINTRTTWVKVMHGAKTYSYIKRHNIKHNVKLYCKRGIPYETFHTTIRHYVISTQALDLLADV